MSTSDGYNFDNSGNTTRDAQNRKFTYDGENKQIKVETVDANGTVTGLLGEYWYDGDGKRVKKHSFENSEWITTIFIYDASGKLIEEYSTKVETTNPKVSYLTNDHLGSPRITTDRDGQTISRRDFQPFGEEIAANQRTQGLGYTEDTVRQKFTSYERDNETDLDFAQARYYNKNHGRFTSPDPTLLSVNGFNGQTWNRYNYVLNNPLKYIDPLGLWELEAVDETRDKKNRDGTVTKVFVRRTIIAKKTQVGDNGATLAKQLGLKGKEATKFAEKIGDGDNIQLSKQGGDVGRIFDKVEDGLTAQKKFEDENPNKVGQGPRSADCSETACQIAYPQQLFGKLVFSVQEADQTITQNNARSVEESDLRIGDIVRWAKDGNPTHFASFIFRRDDGQPEVFSKTGAKGPYERQTIKRITADHPSYGNVTGIQKSDTGYYRP